LLRSPPVCLQQLLAALDDAPQVGDVADRRMRVNAMEEEQFGSIEGANASQVPLIEQGLADRAVGSGGNSPDSLVQVPIGPEKVRPEMPDDRVLRSRRNEFDDGKPISDGIMISGCQHGANLKCGSSTPAAAALIDLPDPVHLEVGVQRELVAEPE